MRLLTKEPMSPDTEGIEEANAASYWIEVADGPIRWVELSMAGLDHLHFYVPDPRLEGYTELELAEVYSVLRRRFPVFGRVEGVEWRIGGTTKLRGWDAQFYDEVLATLKRNAAVTEAIMKTGLPEVEVSTGGTCWVICDKHPGTITQSTWDCYQAVARALLPMPMPAEKQLSSWH